MSDYAAELFPPQGRRVSSDSVDDARICEKGGRGLVLPLLESEYKLNESARAIIYFVLLIWCFIGVSVVADIFMSAIETITSRMTTVKLKSGSTVAVKVWNQTVANLTLLALGSSAPEIMLAVVEIVGAGFYSGNLGPGTIVGSAIFNMLIIVAICVYVIPTGEVRVVSQLGVYIWTSAASVFAYLWLMFVIQVWTPDVVEIWEGVMTLVFFPILVVVAYTLDVIANRPDKCTAARTSLLERGEQHPCDDEVQVLARCMSDLNSKSRAAHRLEVSFFNRPGVGKSELSVGFVASSYCFAGETSTQGQLQIAIEKVGSQAEEARVAVVFATSKVPDDCGDDSRYVPFTGMADIPSGTCRGTVVIPPRPRFHLGDDGGPAQFNVEILRAVRLSANKAKKFANLQEELMASSSSAIKLHLIQEKSKTRVQLGKTHLSGRGVLGHMHGTVEVCPDSRANTVVNLPVEREGGTEGTLVCRYHTEASTAKAGRQFEHIEGELEFPPGVRQQFVSVTIMERSKEPGTPLASTFYVHLTDTPTDHAVVSKARAACAVTLLSEGGRGICRTASPLGVPTTQENIRVSEWDSWRAQISQALSPLGDDDEVETATPFEWMLHIIALPWKLFFALIPPVRYCGGWPTFVCALMGITMITTLIGDLASLFGCVAGLKDAVTAITLVALGTSLPDTFASKSAAVEESTADSALGNVTGSNAVNVFLGLGLPWSIAAIYWQVNGANSEWKRKYPDVALDYPDGVFVVEAGDLTFSVIVFLVCAACFFLVMAFRRVYLGAELGGPQGAKTITAIFFIILWCFYIAVSAWNAYSPNASTADQAVAVVCGVACVFLGLLISGGISLLWRRASHRASKTMRGFALTVQKEGYHPGSWQHLPVPVGGMVIDGTTGIAHPPYLAGPGGGTTGFPAVPEDPENPREALLALEAHIAGLQAVHRMLKHTIMSQEYAAKRDGPGDIDPGQPPKSGQAAVKDTTGLRPSRDLEVVVTSQQPEGLHQRKSPQPIQSSGSDKSPTPVLDSAETHSGDTEPWRSPSDVMSPTPTTRLKKKKIVKKSQQEKSNTQGMVDTQDSLAKDNNNNISNTTSDALQYGKALLEDSTY